MSRDNLTLRVLTPDDWAVWRALRLAALADAPHAFGASLVDWSGRGDSEPRWRARLTHVTRNVVAMLAAHPVGMVSGATSDDDRVELLSMWVAPGARGHGVADRLIEDVVSWADRQGAREVWLRVYVDNQPALACYLRCGFVTARRIEARSAGRASELLLVRSRA